MRQPCLAAMRSDEQLIHCIKLLLGSGEVAVDVSSVTVPTLLTLLQTEPQAKAGCLKALQEASQRLYKAQRILGLAVQHLGGAPLNYPSLPPSPRPMTNVMAGSTHMNGSQPKPADSKGTLDLSTSPPADVSGSTGVSLEDQFVKGAHYDPSEISVKYHLMVPVRRRRESAETGNILISQADATMPRQTGSVPGRRPPAILRPIFWVLRTACAVATAPLHLVDHLARYDRSVPSIDATRSNAAAVCRTSNASGWSCKLRPSYLGQSDEVALSSHSSSSSQDSMEWPEEVDSDEFVSHVSFSDQQQDGVVNARDGLTGKHVVQLPAVEHTA